MKRIGAGMTEGPTATCCTGDIEKHVDYCLESFKNNTHLN
jgi:hypothetical protein